MELVRDVSIGADIEWFLQNEKTKEIVSAENIVKGTKSNPFKFDSNNPFFATSLDNVLAEGNIPPATNAYEFFRYVERLRAYIDSTIPKELKTVALPSARLDRKFLETENAAIFGCDPSLNCWTRQEVRPEPSGDNCRSAGFHIHVGYKDHNKETNFIIARAMDLYLGIPSVLVEPQNERKAVGYGQASNFRHQKHGMEYRTLSSFFSSERKYINWCYRRTMDAIDFVNDGNSQMIDNMGNEIQRIINEEDKKAAKELVDRFKIELV